MSIFRNLLIAKKNNISKLIDGMFLESIVFDGNSFIDTGINYQSCIINTKMSFDYNGTRMLHGWGEQAGEYWGSNISNKYELGENTFLENSDTTQINDIKISVDAINNTTTLIVNGETLTRTGNGSIPNNTYKIGSIGAYNFHGKVCYHSVRDINGVLIQELKPCLDSDGIPCFYDTVSDSYFYNQGSGKFNYIGHTSLKELNTSGIYIDTGVIPTLNTSFEIETSIASNYINGRELFGSTNSENTDGSFGILSNSSNNTFGFYRWGNNVECIFVDTLSHIYYLSNTKAKIDGVEYSLPEGVNTNNNTYTLTIGGFNRSGVIYPAPQKVKKCQIWENNILIRYFIPVLRADGIECMFDEVEQKYYERLY